MWKMKQQSTQQNSNILPLTGNTFYLMLREDFICLCQHCTYRKSEKSKSSPYCKALILAIMEHWTNNKIDNKKDCAISMTLPQWEEAMYGIFGHCAIADSLEELVHDELLLRIEYKTGKGGKGQYKYVLNHQKISQKLRELIGPPSSTNRNSNREQSLQGEDASSKSSNSSHPNLSLASSKSSSIIDSNIDSSTDTRSSTRSRANDDGSSFSESQEETNQSSEEKAKANDTMLPASEETRGETPSTSLETQIVCFKDRDEQALWLIASKAYVLQEKRLGATLEPWDKPKKLQREQITELVQKLGERGYTVDQITPEMIEQAWIDEMEAKKYLKRDPVAKLGNMCDALLGYLADRQPAPTEERVVISIEEERDQGKLVLWTRQPDCWGEYQWEDFELMTLQEAQQYKYHQPHSSYFLTPEQEAEFERKVKERKLQRSAKIAG
jgi:hypothetical protein